MIRVTLGLVLLVVIVGCSSQNCTTEKVTVQAKVASHSVNSNARDITVFVLEDGTTHTQRHHIGHLGDVYPVQVKVKSCRPKM